VDINQDGVLDVVFHNQSQESCVLLGNPRLVAGKRTPLSIQVTGRSGIIGSRVRFLDTTGRLIGMRDVSEGNGRSQPGTVTHFAAPSGTYRIEVRSSSGVIRAREVTVGTTPVRTTVDLD
jgi:hypothetical protein